MKMSKRAMLLALSLATALSVSTLPAHASVNLQGSGASFVGNVLDACKSGFSNKTKNTVVYSPLGSSTGVRNADGAIGDFWFSDAAHLASTRRASVINVPLVAAPIAVLHNLPARTQLYLSPETIAGIFAGTITKWNDPKIVADNNRSVTEVVYKKDTKGNVLKDKDGKNVVLRTQVKNIRYTLPNQDIKVFYRSDGSGTTNNFTRYLNAVAPSIWNKPANNAFTTVTRCCTQCRQDQILNHVRRGFICSCQWLEGGSGRKCFGEFRSADLHCNICIHWCRRNQ
jgi:phosphate transport system substrate-binding protein